MSNQSPKKLPTLRDSKDPEQLDIFQREVRHLFQVVAESTATINQNITNIYGGVGTVTSVTGTAPISVTPTMGAVNVSLLGTYVNSLAATGAITLSGSTGNVTIGTNLSAYPTGSGTLNRVAKWTPSGTQLGNASILDSSSAVRAEITSAGAILLGDTANTSVDVDTDTLNLRNTSHHTGSTVRAISVDLTSQAFGDWSTQPHTQTSVGVDVVNPTTYWLSGALVDGGNVLSNYGYKATVTDGRNGTNYGLYADVSGNTTNYAFYGNAGLFYNAGDAWFGNNVTVSNAVVTPIVETGYVHATQINQDLKLGSTFAGIITERDMWIGGSTPFSGPYGARNLTVSGDATVKGPNGVTVSTAAATQAQYALTQAGQATWYIYEPSSSNDLKVFSSAIGAPVAYFDGALGDLKLSYGLTVAGNTVLGDATADRTVINGNTLMAASGAGLAANSGLDLVIGRDSGGGALTNGDISFQWHGGGYRHYITSSHDGVASSTGNAIKFYLNNSTTSGGSSAPGTGSQLVLELLGDNSVHVPGALKVDGSVVVGDNSGTDTLTVKQGTAPTGLVAAPSGAVIIVEQQNAVAGYVAFRSNTASGLSWANAGSGTDGKLTYDSNARAMQFATATTYRMGIDSNGSIFMGDTSLTAVADNVDVVTIGNSGTGQTADVKALLRATHTGSLNTTAAALTTTGGHFEVTASRSAGANNLTNRAIYAKATTGQVNYSFYGDGGTLYNLGDASIGGFLLVSGSAQVSTNFQVSQNLTAGDASTDTHTVNGNVTFSNTPTAGPIKYGALQMRSLIKIQSFSASGTYTPSTGCKAARVKIVGGGGGGGGASATAGHASAGGGGGSGAYVEFWLDASADLTTSASNVTIGTGGAAGSSAGGNGGNGGDTTVIISGTTFTAKGGTGGTGGTQNGVLTQALGGYPQSGSGANASGTFASLATSALAGGEGGLGLMVTDGTTSTVGGCGGGNPLGIGGTSNKGQAAQGKGAGGAGARATSANVAGEAGLNGYIIIEEYA